MATHPAGAWPLLHAEQAAYPAVQGLPFQGEVSARPRAHQAGVTGQLERLLGMPWRGRV